MTVHGATGMFIGGVAVDISAWQGLTLDDDFAIDPPPPLVWVDPDGVNGALAGEFGFDDNFHLRSPFGQAMTGALAPILDRVSSGTGLPFFELVTYVGGPGPGDAGVSPAIDAGDPDFPHVAETLENGKYINLGTYGDTLQASNTETEYIHVVFPLGTEQLASSSSDEIHWRSHDPVPGETVLIELRHANELGLVDWSDPRAPNTGSYVWTIPPTVPFDDDYVIVIRRPSVLDPGSEVIGISRRTFAIGLVGYGPTVLRVTPEAIDCETVTTQFSSITATFSDNLDLGAASNIAHYELLAGNTLAADAHEIWQVLVAPPQATIRPVVPSVTNGPVDKLTILFDKPVVGMNLADLSLTFSGSRDLLTTGQTLTSIDGQTFTISGIASLSAPAGAYTLRLIAAGSGILDLGDNSLLDDASTSWTTDPTPATSMATIGWIAPISTYWWQRSRPAAATSGLISTVTLDCLLPTSLCGLA